MKTEEKKIEYNSLGGWLMVLQVFIILNGISWLRNLMFFYNLLQEKEKFMNEMQNSAPALYINFIYFELCSAVFMLLFTTALIYFMFRMAKVFKTLMVVFILTEIILELVVFLIFGPLMQASGGLPQERLYFTTAIAGLIIYYIVKSERVKQTFVK